MALGFYITAKGFTQDRYDTTTVQLEEAGVGAPDGASPRRSRDKRRDPGFRHLGVPGGIDAFGATLIPILTAAGIELNEPMVARVHNEIKS